MPLFIPILIGVAVVSAMGLGGKKGYDGVSDMRDAKRVQQAAQERYDRNKRRLEDARQGVTETASTFGTFKLEVARDTLGDMVKLLEELQRRGKLTSFDSLASVDLEPKKLLVELKEVSGTATAILAGVVLGAVKGALTGTALYGLAGVIGVASTGAAIGGLSGAAATSATLAWLGGGALAGGGGGVFLGTIVLGGVVAAPVFLITGFVLAKKGAEALKGAAEFVAKVDVAVETMDAMQEVLGQIRTRIGELTEVISELSDRVKDRLAGLWAMLGSYDEHKKSHSAKLATALKLSKGLADLLKVPVVAGDNGEVNPELPGIIARYRTLNP